MQLINVTLNASIINVSFAATFPIQNFLTDNFSGYQLAYIWKGLFLLPLKCSINFSLSLLGTRLLYLLEYDDEQFFHACTSFGLSPGFKLNGNS